MKRIAIAFATLLTALVVAALPHVVRPAVAGEVWCWDDPIIEVDGVVYSVDLGVRASQVEKVYGADIVFTVLPGTVVRVLYIDPAPYGKFVRVQTIEGASSPVTPKTLGVTVDIRAGQQFDYQIVVSKIGSLQQVPFAELTANQGFRTRSIGALGQVMSHTSANTNTPKSLVFNLQ